MTSYTTRVELHAATYTDYEILHSRMHSEGFSRQITSDNGVTYQLPTAEYDISGYMTESDVLERAERAIRATGKLGAVLVTTATSRMWRGLAFK
jgi:hypothetical protein